MARPRSEQARREALAATAELLAEAGVEGLSFEQVACRSGVAKSTLYRHWPARTALLIDAVRTMFPHICTPDTGSLRQDLLELLDGFINLDLSAPRGRVLPSLLAAANRDPEIDRLVAELAEERSRPVRDVLARARDRGELPGDLDLDVALVMVVGPLLYRRVNLRLAVDRALLEACLDTALAGLRAVGATSATP